MLNWPASKVWMLKEQMLAYLLVSLAKCTPLFSNVGARSAGKAVGMETCPTEFVDPTQFVGD